ncbi:MAG: DUF3846 domain-containing protein [Oscillospiraceae bacterium]|nr:DUF3846 domain-containing protein [Oscillospiraceae bacterium]
MIMDSRHVLKNLPLLTKEDCDPAQEQFQNKLLILRSELLTPECRYAPFQYFYALGGFGCDPKARGRKVIGSFLADGERTEMRRSDFLGAADPKKLPKWAADRLAEIQSPKMEIRIFQVDHDKDPDRLAYEPLRDLPNGTVNASMYRQVYGGRVNGSSLEEVFRLCNEAPPPGFTGESMSVGNVIEVQYGRQKGFYFCDRAGFQKIEFAIDRTDHAQMLRVLICEPNKEPYPAEIRDDLRAMQSVVGGLIEPVYFDENGKMLAFCDEEFLFKDYAPNRQLGEVLIQGTFFICGDGYDDEGEKVSVSLNDAQIQMLMDRFRYPLVDISDNEIVQEESQDMGISQV